MVPVSKHHTMEAYKGVRLKLHSFLTLNARRSRMGSITLSHSGNPVLKFRPEEWLSWRFLCLLHVSPRKYWDRTSGYVKLSADYVRLRHKRVLSHSFHFIVLWSSLYYTYARTHLYIYTHTHTHIYIYRVIHKSLRNFRNRLRNNQDRHSRKEHINR
jgi:hypothetical protein